MPDETPDIKPLYTKEQLRDFAKRLHIVEYPAEVVRLLATKTLVSFVQAYLWNLLAMRDKRWTVSGDDMWRTQYELMKIMQIKYKWPLELDLDSTE